MHPRSILFRHILPAGLTWLSFAVSAPAQPTAAALALPKARPHVETPLSATQPDGKTTSPAIRPDAATSPGITPTAPAALPPAATATDSLALYIEVASGQNPALKAAWATYQAALEKVPQAFALPDPELEIGWFVKPMEVLGGKQIANFTLMQMFPWFGSRQAARAESEKMARMTYEQFRDARNQTAYEVKSQWYRLCNLNDQLHTTEANLSLLDKLEQLVVNRFAAGGIGSAGSNPSAAPSPSDGMPSAPASAGGMSGMGGMGSASAPSTATTSSPAAGITTPSGAGLTAGNAAASMSAMGSSAMGSSGSGSLADVLRIQMEKAETEDKLAAIRSAQAVALARFNVLLGREAGSPVCLPDSLVQHTFLPGGTTLQERIETHNPMLTMLEAEGDAYRAKARMDKRMSYPMLGIGLQYSLLGKSDDTSMARMAGMNGKDMFMPMFKISLPIYRRKYNAQQRESRLYREASRLKQENTRRQLLADYTDLSKQLEDAGRQVKLYTAQTERAATAYRLMVNAFAAGLSPLTDVIGVERQWLDYRLKKSEAIATYNTVVAGIERLLGEGAGER